MNHHLERYKNISVLGAAGKMGSGILLLNVLHSAKLMHHPDYVGQTFVVNAIDQSFEQLDKLNHYIKDQVTRWAEKNIIWLRKAYNNRPHLIDNKDIIDTFVFEALSLIKPSINIEPTYRSTLIFEAIIENEDVKTKLFKQINDNNPNKPFFLSNTSSIPISVLNDKAELNGNIIGCHFYNPPAVQKLIEVIETENGNPDLTKLVYGFANHMQKVLVPSNDLAGFIGNGFLMRDILYAEKQYNNLKPDMGHNKTILSINTISHELLIRPMGIFQLIDYVGIEVCTYIMKVMNHYLEDELISPLLNKLLSLGIKGGQNPDGTQKDGFFQYSEGDIVGIYDLESKSYISTGDLMEEVKHFLAVKTEAYSWKQLSQSKRAAKHLDNFFSELIKENSIGAKMACNYMRAMKDLGIQLQADGVCSSTEHVNTVMKNGFFHLYGPVNNYI
ncbi:3-hydroxyacyl-CoA dehydrogenase family protein [Carboxylicivirga sp. N1Y90]|uniref:3-hydroxyacyl-CoA dehydrogenase family protein n=1 Tax=Carboxylicivirga fragile TaxID=3417571 RepID=UPI003D33E88B|nr:3-hydroxyacyl-CoA dehydrogenase family protein [Marinilabiliaceae bacterium N1Y90]